MLRLKQRAGTTGAVEFYVAADHVIMVWPATRDSSTITLSTGLTIEEVLMPHDLLAALVQNLPAQEP
jgi:hypothetical protein